jgi:hypothetical protein
MLPVEKVLWAKLDRDSRKMQAMEANCGPAAFATG